MKFTGFNHKVFDNDVKPVIRNLFLANFPILR